MSSDWYEDQIIGSSGQSPTRTITDHDIFGFGGITGDMAELHTSDTVANASHFGTRVAHGMLSLSLMHGLVVRSGRLVTSGMAVLGWSQIKFVAPVPVGTTVRAEWETIGLRESASRPDAGIVTDRLTLTNTEGTLLVTGDVAELVRRRPS
ncbi:Bifunctional protein PaaZ [Marinovum algicola]|uniref:Acyl dehydratase n=1 Tax=Marinovum algicola TaxID=42444 RepID=A0A975WBX4_9RHOB|nr:MaoC/PaaZ C-terminal domain-containing protein [Marinovum algicola]SEJ83509.1 Acyl dehydratase [Marinovum algicola]SLN62251.1 Bifunctional protein PaaZ [Marinovum algicola]